MQVEGLGARPQHGFQSSLGIRSAARSSMKSWSDLPTVIATSDDTRALSDDELYASRIEPKCKTCRDQKRVYEFFKPGMRGFCQSKSCPDCT